MHVIFEGTEIDSFRFETTWPKARFRHDGRHFMDKSFRLEAVDDTQKVEVLTPVMAQWFNAGSLEFVQRTHQLPHCILAFGAVPKNTAPLRRHITDAQPINRYAKRWRVKYATVQEICLMLTPCALMWIRGLCNAYHLVRLGGCRGATRKLLRWITNRDGSGYDPAPTFESGCGPG